jgi:carbon-monoxide dehydrogenase large subunit
VTLDDPAPCKTNPPGAKGCGSRRVGGLPCIATRDGGSERTRYQKLTTPLTPAKVWQAIRDAKAAG